MARIYAGIFGLVAFLVMLVHGVIHEADPGNAVLVAWCSLLIFAALGYVIGWIAGRAVEESVQAIVAAEVAANQAGEASQTSKPGT